MTFKNLLKNPEIVEILPDWVQYSQKTFSQCGEDIIIKFIFNTIGVNCPSYLDIGANHPYYFNNTALFYLDGSSGVNVEPDPFLNEELKRCRYNDINLVLGISDCDSEQDFYIMNEKTLNTFSRDIAESVSREGNYFIEKIIKVKTTILSTIVSEYFGNRELDLLNIDAEGVDDLVIKSLDKCQQLPKVICIETMLFSNSGHGIKNISLQKTISSMGYLLYADTYLNSIFVLESLWRK